MCFGFHASKILVKLQGGRRRSRKLRTSLHSAPARAGGIISVTERFGLLGPVCLPQDLPMPEGFAWKGLRELFGQWTRT